MENEEIAVAIGILQTKFETLSNYMEKSVEQIQKSIEDLQKVYSGNFDKIDCKIEERIKFSDDNQKKLETRIVKLEKNYAIVYVVATIVTTLVFKAIDFIF